MREKKISRSLCYCFEGGFVCHQEAAAAVHIHFPEAHSVHLHFVQAHPISPHLLSALGQDLHGIRTVPIRVHPGHSEAGY